MELGIGSKVLCQWDDNHYCKIQIDSAEIVQERKTPIQQYYIHYIGFNKRLDRWVLPEQVRPQSSDVAHDQSMLTRFNKRKRAELHPGDVQDPTNPAMAHWEKDHEESTKIRNVDKIVFGKFEIQPWYYSPYLPKHPHIRTLYICEFCLKYMRHGRNYLLHVKKCKAKKPEGKLIYRDKVNLGKTKSISVYELDGSQHKLYCQNFCLLAKLFLDHKTLYYYVHPFKFYVLTEDYGRTSRIAGYFSKECCSDEYNLACILVLPQHQRKGYGRFLIALSYALSKREGKIGTPERPLSDMGRVSYKSYWTETLLEVLYNRGSISVKELSEETGITIQDVLDTLSGLQLVKYWKGQYIINTPNIAKVYKELIESKISNKPQGVKFNPLKLR